MLRLAVLFLLIALVAAAFGLFNVAGVAWDGFRVLAFIFRVLAVLSFFAGAMRAPPPV